MFFEKLSHLRCVVVGGVVNEENNAFELLSRRVRDDITQVLAELNISASIKEVPYDAFFWPKEGDEAVYAFVVTECWDVDNMPFFRPSSFRFTEEFNPFLILESDKDLFFKRAGAMRLYRWISSRLR